MFTGALGLSEYLIPRAPIKETMPRYHNQALFTFPAIQLLHLSSTITSQPTPSSSLYSPLQCSSCSVARLQLFTIPHASASASLHYRPSSSVLSPPHLMSEADTSVDVASWLSQVESTTFSDTSPSINRKRKCNDNENSSKKKHPPRPRATARQVLAQLYDNAINPRVSRAMMSPKKKQIGQARTPLLEYS